MHPSKYRYIYAGLAAALLAVILLGVAFAGGGENSGRPEVLEGIYPAPSSRVSSTDVLEVDVPPDYVVELWIDFRGSGSSQANWVKVPPSEVDWVQPTGVFTWAPGPDRILEAWPQGPQRVRVTWDTRVGLPDAGSYEWSFRVAG